MEDNMNNPNLPENLPMVQTPQVIQPGPVQLSRQIPDGAQPEEYVKTLDLETLQNDLTSANQMIEDMNFTLRGFRNLKNIIQNEIKSRKKK